MPELPEVEIFKRFIDHNALNQTITAVTVRHPKGLRDISPETLSKITQGQQFSETLRRGKYLLAKLEPSSKASASKKVKTKHPEAWILFHFGMTGCLSYKPLNQPGFNAYEDDVNRDAHIRVSFTLADGGQLHFHDQRLFGYVSLVEDPQTYFQSKKLGPDALSITEAEFLSRLAGRKGAVKPVLMDQSVVAGLGNIYADELLFQTHIHPERSVASLTPAACKKLYHLMQDILSRTIALEVERDDLPADYLWHQRKTKGYCPRDGLPLSVQSVGGRTTYFCPHCQV
jgi:formamidopyrimidine-DNA glycosylase